MRRLRRRELPGRHIPTEMVREILLKLPTRDVIRSSFVSKQWSEVVDKDPSFRELHAAEHAVPSHGGGAEALLVTLNHVPKTCTLEPSVYSLTTSKLMCRLTGGATALSHDPTNVCNGFICFEPNVLGVSPAVLCNPATGETLALPQAPPISDDDDDDEIGQYLYLLGFSPSTAEYKLFRFRLSFRELCDDRGHYVDVYTLGDNRGWRRHWNVVPFRQMYRVPPVYVDGRLYVVTNPFMFAGNPEGILVVDVASEAHCIYRLPKDYADLEQDVLQVDILELHGQFCLAVNYVLVCPDRPKVEFWVMPRLGQLDRKNHRRLNWELRYTFHVDVDHARRKAAHTPHEYKDQQRAAWLDEDETLCYVLGDTQYKYSTRDQYSRPDADGILAWHQKVQLQTTPSPSSSNRGWNILGGYRPSFLSPLAFALPSSSQEDEDNGQFEHGMLRALHPHSSKRRPSNDRTSGNDEPGRKRICCGTTFSTKTMKYANKEPKERKSP